MTAPLQGLLWHRLYPEARAEAERGIALAPANLRLAQERAMSRLGEGDLAGARAGLRDVLPMLDRAALGPIQSPYVYACE